MSIRYKSFGAFSVMIAIACGLAFYGIRGISTSGDLVGRLYDGPLMAINHARSAHAALNDARLLMQRGLSGSEPEQTVGKLEKLLADVEDDLGVVRVRADNKDVATALERAETSFRDWSKAGLMIIKPAATGHTALPLTFSVVHASALARMEVTVERKASISASICVRRLTCSALAASFERR